MKSRTLKDFNVKNKKILVRVDFNTPLNKKGNIKDDNRIKQSLPTIKYLIKNKAIIILATHLGNPKGKKIKTLKTNKLAKRLSKLLKKPVKKLNNCIGKNIEKQINTLKPSNIILLENLRFYKQETNNNKTFAKALSKLADIYIDDAFGTIHRNHASITGITAFLPGGIGFLVEKEIKILSKLKKPKKPFIAIIGGIKQQKIKFLKKLIKKTDKIIIGSALSKKVKIKHKKIIFPLDFTKNNLDIGPKSIKNIKSILKNAKTIFWAGPLGVIEKKQYAKATIEIAKFLARSKALTIVGGGETAEIIHKLKLEKKFTHISTGGGAALEFIENNSLIGITALKRKSK